MTGRRKEEEEEWRHWENKAKAKHCGGQGRNLKDLKTEQRGPSLCPSYPLESLYIHITVSTLFAIKYFRICSDLFHRLSRPVPITLLISPMHRFSESCALNLVNHDSYILYGGKNTSNSRPYGLHQVEAFYLCVFIYKSYWLHNFCGVLRTWLCKIELIDRSRSFARNVICGQGLHLIATPNIDFFLASIHWDIK
jgi:hypothetical protein